LRLFTPINTADINPFLRFAKTDHSAQRANGEMGIQGIFATAFCGDVTILRVPFSFFYLGVTKCASKPPANLFQHHAHSGEYLSITSYISLLKNFGA
jgi:hypothetical protein